MTAQGNIYGINGPIIYLKGDSGFQMNEMVYVGTGRLVGEVIGLTSERTTIEVYEETTGLKPGEPVAGTGAPVSATLAPGILTSIFDGIQKESGCYIDRGIHADSLDTKKKWHAHMTVKKGDRLYPGAVIAEVPETRAITHKVMVPPDMEGFVLSVAEDGDYTIELLSSTLENGDREFVRFRFESEEDFTGYIQSLQSRSTFRSHGTAVPGDWLVNLCTCIYEQNNARYLVAGSPLPVSESGTQEGKETVRQQDSLQ